MITPRILYDNYAAASTTVQSASSEDVSFELIKLPDQARGRRWRTKTGWTIVPGFNDALPYWTTNDGWRIAYVAPGTYATGAAMATATVSAMNVGGSNPRTQLACSAWWRADSVVLTASGLVSQATDLSGNGRNVTQANTALQPLWVANVVDGRPGFYFNNTAGMGLDSTALMSTMLAATTGRGTVVTVFKLDSDATPSDMLWIAGSSGHFAAFYWNSGNSFNADAFDTANRQANKTVTTGVDKWHHGWWEYDGTNVAAYVSNANTAGAGTAAMSGNMHADVLASTFHLGGNTGAPLKGYILECIVFPTALTEAQRRAVTQYLKARYPSLVANDSTTAPTWTDTQGGSYNGTLKQFAFTTTAAQMTFPMSTGNPSNDRLSGVYKDLGFNLVDKTNTTAVSSMVADNVAYQSRAFVKLDFGSALAITSAVALDHNAGSGGTFTLEGNDVDLWVSPAVSQALTGDSAQRSAYFASSSRRWRRLVIDDVQNAAGYSELGVLFAGPYLQPPYPYSDTYQPGSNAFSQRTYGAYGSLHLDQRPRQRKWHIEFDTMDQATVDLFDAMETVTPPGRAFFFLFDAAAPTGIRYVELEDPIEYVPVPPIYFTVQMPIKEVLP